MARSRANGGLGKVANWTTLGGPRTVVSAPPPPPPGSENMLDFSNTANSGYAALLEDF